MKLPAVNFQYYSIKSTDFESYPQAALRLLKHCVMSVNAPSPSPSHEGEGRHLILQGLARALPSPLWEGSGEGVGYGCERGMGGLLILVCLSFAMKNSYMALTRRAGERFQAAISSISSQSSPAAPCTIAIWIPSSRTDTSSVPSMPSVCTIGSGCRSASYISTMRSSPGV